MTPRERAIAWAQDMIALSAVVVDTETLGKPHDAGLCDVAIVAVSGEVILNSYVDPGKPIPADASAVHGITDADVAGAPTFPTIYRDIRSVLSGRVVIAYNSSFDAGCINTLSRLAGLPEIAQDWHCAMLNYSSFDGATELHRFKRYGRWTAERKLRWWKLGEAAAAMGIENPGAHRALADAETTRLLVLAMAGMAEVKAEPEPVQSTFLSGRT